MKLSLPLVLRLIGAEARRNGTDRLRSRQIDRIIKGARKRARMRKPASHA
jgi:hypothetical protein